MTNPHTVIATITRADGTVQEVRVAPLVACEAYKVGKKKVPVRKDRVKPCEAQEFIAEIPVFQDGKLVGFREEERKTAAIVGGIPLSRLDLSRFKRA
jgi:Asp-tRNA(Asn)/Glu-tRNA(Gln) amidotransferase C subunit